MVSIRDSGIQTNFTLWKKLAVGRCVACLYRTAVKPTKTDSNWISGRKLHSGRAVLTNEIHVFHCACALFLYNCSYFNIISSAVSALGKENARSPHNLAPTSNPMSVK